MQTDAPKRAPDIDWSKVPSNPGFAYLLHIRPDPKDPEAPPVRGWQRQTHGIMYRDKNGRLHTYHYPSTEEAQAQIGAFVTLSRREGFRLVGRQERRLMWVEERRRYKRIQAQRRASERSENNE